MAKKHINRIVIVCLFYWYCYKASQLTMYSVVLRNKKKTEMCYLIYLKPQSLLKNYAL